MEPDHFKKPFSDLLNDCAGAIDNVLRQAQGAEALVEIVNRRAERGELENYPVADELQALIEVKQRHPDWLLRKSHSRLLARMFRRLAGELAGAC